MKEIDVSHEEKWCLLRSTGKNGQKRNASGFLIASINQAANHTRWANAA